MNAAIRAGWGWVLQALRSRLERVEELWDSIADEHEALALTDEQREDFERRLAEADADPSGGSPWEDVRDRIAVYHGRRRPRRFDP